MVHLMLMWQQLPQVLMLQQYLQNVPLALQASSSGYDLPDTDFVKWLATLGIGGVLAAFMFVFYRKDVKQYTELWRVTAENLMGIVKENTASNVKLIALIETQERNSLRVHDIEGLVDRKISDSKLLDKKFTQQK